MLAARRTFAPGLAGRVDIKNTEAGDYRVSVALNSMNMATEKFSGVCKVKFFVK